MQKRKKTYVDAKVQGMLVRRLLRHWAIFLGVAFLVTYCLQVLYNPFQSKGEHLQQLGWTYGPFLLVLLILLPLFILDTIRFSHRFVGPIYRLRRTIHSSALQGGVPPVLKFRDSAYWQGLAEDFNRMIDRISNPSPDMQESNDRLESAKSAELAEPAEVS